MSNTKLPKHDVKLSLVTLEPSIPKTTRRYPLDAVFLYKKYSLIISAIRKGVFLP